MPFLQNLIYNNLHSDITYWAYKVAINGISFITVLLPLLLFYYYFDKKEKHLYGLNNQHIDLTAYWTLLLLMLPLLVSASFLDGFQRQYPMYKSNVAYLYLGVPEWTTVLSYELAYGLDFITVELLFRGFFVIGMIKVLGRHAILPMVVIYCLLHFGKPAGEAISSIAGGYILGVIAYETKSIWGGIIVHMGIAWLMEIIAFLQKLFH
jgi:membrane protease YdiL (CAAX protease family)